MPKLKELTVGADPELFIEDPSDQIIPAFGMVPGTKADPHPVPDGAVQVDGTALEFNIKPAKTSDEFVSNVTNVMNSLRSFLHPDLKFSRKSHVTYNKKVFNSIPGYARELGCSPDYDAWSNCENTIKEPSVGFRTAAGHIHLGWTEDADPFSIQHYESCRLVARELDVFLGLPSVIMDRDGQKRRELYGKAGAFRPKPYGMEYRVLSNFWLFDNIPWAFEQTKKAFSNITRGSLISTGLGARYIRDTINNGDAVVARKLITQYPSIGGKNV